MNDRDSNALDKLSQREIEVVNLLRQGHPREKIASIMGISKLTYDSYRKSIRNKLDIRSQSDWARLLYVNESIKIK
jgi:DNA-binding CsgD family transcriptional regulator